MALLAVGLMSTILCACCQTYVRLHFRIRYNNDEPPTYDEAQEAQEAPPPYETATSTTEAPPRVQHPATDQNEGGLPPPSSPETEEAPPPYSAEDERRRTTYRTFLL